jgi:hypothetical protein
MGMTLYSMGCRVSDSPSVFELIKAIQTKNVDLDDVVLDDYNAWVANIAFSLDPSTIFYANEMNIRAIGDERQFAFYYFLIPKQRPMFRKWPKKPNHGNTEVISRAFNYSHKKAEIALGVLSEDDKLLLTEIYGDKKNE